MLVYIYLIYNLYCALLSHLKCLTVPFYSLMTFICLSSYLYHLVLLRTMESILELKTSWETTIQERIVDSVTLKHLKYAEKQLVLNDDKERLYLDSRIEFIYF